MRSVFLSRRTTVVLALRLVAKTCTFVSFVSPVQHTHAVEVIFTQIHCIKSCSSLSSFVTQQVRLNSQVIPLNIFKNGMCSGRLLVLFRTLSGLYFHVMQ